MQREAKAELIDEALRLRNAGEHRSALDVLLSLVRREEEADAYTWLLLGDTQQQLGDVPAAVESFRAAVSLAPGDYTASSGLFLALWRLGESGDETARLAALEEIRRFVGLAGPEGYAEIVDELFEGKEQLRPDDTEDDDDDESQ